MHGRAQDDEEETRPISFLAWGDRVLRLGIFVGEGGVGCCKEVDVNFPSPKRQATMEMAFAELDKIEQPVMVEVGSMRSISNAESDGHSTLLFSEYAAKREFARWQFKTIDTDPLTESFLRDPYNILNAEIWNMDGVTALIKIMERNHRIDFIYLDAWDIQLHSYDPVSAERHLNCFMLADRCGASLALIDDADSRLFLNNGKAGRILEYIEDIGGNWEVLAHKYQLLLRKRE